MNPHRRSYHVSLQEEGSNDLCGENATFPDTRLKCLYRYFIYGRHTPWSINTYDTLCFTRFNYYQNDLDGLHVMKRCKNKTKGHNHTNWQKCDDFCFTVSYYLMLNSVIKQINYINRRQATRTFLMCIQHVIRTFLVYILKKAQLFFAKRKDVHYHGKLAVYFEIRITYLIGKYMLERNSCLYFHGNINFNFVLYSGVPI